MSRGKIILTKKVLKQIQQHIDDGLINIDNHYHNGGKIDWGSLSQEIKRLVLIKVSGETLRSNSTLRDMLGVPKKKKDDAPPPDVATLMSENRSLKKQLHDLSGWSSNIYRIIEDATARLNLKPLPKQWKKIKPRKHDMSQHGFVSDTHNKSIIRPEDTMGISEYNPEIYAERMELMENKWLSFKEEDREIHGLNKFVLWMGGDLCEGSGVYPGQQISLMSTELEQIEDTANDWINRILRLQSCYEEIEIYFVTGNHGMGSKKKNGFHESWTADNIIALNIMTAFNHSSEFKNVKFYWSKSTKMMVEMGEYIFCLNHGDDCKSWAGIPYYGIDRMVKKMPHMTGNIIHYHLIGHHHTAGILDGEHVIMNGCVPGGSSLSVNKMHVTSQPSQWTWLFHEKHGINRLTNIKLDKRTVLKADKNGILTPYRSN